MDKLTLAFGILIGIVLGFIGAGIFFVVGTADIISHAQFQSINTNVNFTIPINESKLSEKINQNRQNDTGVFHCVSGCEEQGWFNSSIR